MIASLAPEIIQLLNAARDLPSGRSDQAALEAALLAARQFHAESQKRFTFWSHALPDDEETRGMVEHANKLFGERSRGLTLFEAFLASGPPMYRVEGAQLVEEASAHLTDMVRRLEQHKRSFPPLSPMPAVDDFVKVACNVHADRLPASAVTDRMGVMVGTRQQMAQDIETLMDCYPEACEHLEGLEHAAEHFEEGIGAIHAALESGNKQDLRFGIQGLAAASAEFLHHMAQFDAMAAVRGVSQHRFLDFWARRAARHPDQFSLLLEEMQQFVESSIGEVDRFRAASIVRPDVLERFADGLAQDGAECMKRLAAARENGPGQSVERAVIEGVERLLERRAEFFAAARLHPEFGGDEDLGSLWEAIQTVWKGAASWSVLERQAHATKEKLQAIQDRITRVFESGPHPELTALQEAIAGLQQAGRRIDSYLEARDRRDLQEALELLEIHGPALAAESPLLDRAEVVQHRLDVD